MNKEAFTAEMEAASGMLYRVAWSILQQEDACRDAMQETALRAWEKRFTLREPAFFRTWVTRILIRTCYNIRRSNRRWVNLDAIPEPSVPPPDPSLAMALEHLPEQLRLPLVLCYSEGMSYREIAETLRLPQATVRGRIHRGKEKLRKELEEA